MEEFMQKYEDFTKAELLIKMNEFQIRLVEYETTEKVHMEEIECIRKREEEYRLLLDESSDPIYSFYPDGVFRFVNQAYAKWVDMAASEIIGKSVWDIYPQEEARKRFGVVQSVFDFGETSVVEEKIPSTEGDVYYITSAKPIKDDIGNVISAICISKEISKRKELEEKLQKMSIHDELTGLYNRYYLEEELKRFQRGRNFPVSIVVADMDNLKYVNDNYGHSSGDSLIRIAARTIQSTFRADDIIARSGGDEFVVLLPKTDLHDAEAVVARLRESLEEEENVLLNLSIGLAVGRKGSYLPDVIRLADDCMYQDKALKRKMR
jgi:diguanylate cyclase (GGDEF)-like protein/PAS domain S-box-containing protein